MTVQATLHLGEACRRPWDVIVIGAGPTGSLAARHLALHGADVLLVDKAQFPRRKVCGGCLNLRALAALDKAGLGGLVERCGAPPLHRLRLAASGWQAFVPVGGRSLSREAFDAALVEAAIQAGAHFLPGTQARLALVTSTARKVVLRQEGRPSEALAAVVLGADGLGGRLLAGEADHRSVVEAGSRLGAGLIVDKFPEDFFEVGTIFMACGSGGYVGLVRLEDGRLNLAAAFDTAWVKRAGGLGKAATAILRESGMPTLSEVETLPWQGTPLLSRHVSPPAAERVFLLGDAAGYVEPFTGEGMAWGLASAGLVVPLVKRCLDRFGGHGWSPALAGQWSVLHRRAIRRRQWVCRALAQVLRQPALVRLVVAALARFPVLASPFVYYLNHGPSRDS